MPRGEWIAEYSTADVSKKLGGVIVQLSKNQLQLAMYLLHDSIGMLQKMSGNRLDLKRDELPAYLVSDRLGAQAGGFRRAVITERIVSAIGEIKIEAWQRAAWEVRDAVELLDRLGVIQNKNLKRRATPIGMARHSV